MTHTLIQTAGLGTRMVCSCAKWAHHDYYGENPADGLGEVQHRIHVKLAQRAEKRSGKERQSR